MIYQDQLTNEALKKHFKDNFALAHFAIDAARYLIRAGHEVNIPTLLRDIQRNPSLFSIEELSMLEKGDENPSL